MNKTPHPPRGGASERPPELIRTHRNRFIGYGIFNGLHFLYLTPSFDPEYLERSGMSTATPSFGVGATMLIVNGQTEKILIVVIRKHVFQMVFAFLITILCSNKCLATHRILLGVHGKFVLYIVTDN